MFFHYPPTPINYNAILQLKLQLSLQEMDMAILTKRIEELESINTKETENVV